MFSQTVPGVSTTLDPYHYQLNRTSGIESFGFSVFAFFSDFHRVHLSQTSRMESFDFSVPAVRIVSISQLPENTLESQICLCVIRLPDKSPTSNNHYLTP
jgi:hypothetical protein